MRTMRRAQPFTMRMNPSLVKYLDVDLQEYLFVIGGMHVMNSSVYYKSVDLYNIEQNEWRNMPSLNICRSRASSAAIQEKVYTFCGYNYFDKYLDSIERLDARSCIRGNEGVEW